MELETVMYLGREVPKEGFRVFVYGRNDTQQLIESWEYYEQAMASGIWFDSKASVAFEEVAKAPVSEVVDIKQEAMNGPTTNMLKKERPKTRG